MGFVSDVILLVFLVTERVRVAHRAANETRVEAGREVISLSYFVGGDDGYLSLFGRADMSDRVDPVSRKWGGGGGLAEAQSRAQEGPQPPC